MLTLLCSSVPQKKHQSFASLQTIFAFLLSVMTSLQEARVRRDAYEAHFRRVIEEGIKQNVFHVQDACIATMFVFSTLNWTYQWFHPDGPLTIEQLADQYNIFIMRALKEGQQ
jgi:hypothetical protein